MYLSLFSPAIPEVLLWEIFRGSGAVWSDLWNNSRLNRNPKVVVVTAFLSVHLLFLWTKCIILVISNYI